MEILQIIRSYIISSGDVILISYIIIYYLLQL